MKTALAILSDKKVAVMGSLNGEAADHKWLNFLEGMLMIATCNALCTVDNDSPNWGERLACSVARDAGLLINLGQAVPAEKLKLPTE